MIANLEGGQKASLAPRKKKELDDHTGLNWCLGGSSKIVGHWIFEVGTEIEEHFFLTDFMKFHEIHPRLPIRRTSKFRLYLNKKL